MALVGVAFGVLAAFCLAGQALTIRLATRDGRTLDVLLIVLFINAATFAVLSAIFVPDPVVTPTSFLAFLGTGIVATLVARACFYSSIGRIGASRAEPIKASMPLPATVLAVLLFGEHVSGVQFGAIVLIVVGVALVSWEGARTDRALGTDVSIVALLLAVASAVLFALEPLFAVVGFREGTSPLVGLTIKTGGAFVILAAFVAWRDSVPYPSDIRDGNGRWYLLAGLASTGFMIFDYVGLSLSRVGVVVPIMQTSPLVVAAGSALFMRDLERVTPRLVAASVVIVIGAALVTLSG